MNRYGLLVTTHLNKGGESIEKSVFFFMCVCIPPYILIVDESVDDDDDDDDCVARGLR